MDTRGAICLTNNSCLYSFMFVFATSDDHGQPLTRAVPAISTIAVFPFDVALEALLPELLEPRIPEIRVRTEPEVVLVKVGYLGRVEFHRDTAGDVILDAFHHIRSNCPAVAARTRTSALHRFIADLAENWHIFRTP